MPKNLPAPRSLTPEVFIQALPIQNLLPLLLLCNSVATLPAGWQSVFTQNRQRHTAMSPAYKNKLGTQKVHNRVGNTVFYAWITSPAPLKSSSFQGQNSPHSFLPGNWNRSHTCARQILYHWVRFLDPGFLRWDLIMEHSSLTSKSPCHPGLSWTTILLLTAWLKVCIIISNYHSPLKQQLHLGRG